MLMKMRSKMQRTNNQKGFTLVELMVVVVIIGILVAIAVPIYKNIQETAQANACKASQRTILSVIEVYKADNNGAAPANIKTDLVDKGYLKAVPQCPGDATHKTPTDFTISGECPLSIDAHKLTSP